MKIFKKRVPDKHSLKKEFENDLVSVLKTELISPLEVIRTTCDLLLKGVAGHLQPEQQDFIFRISKQTKKSLSFIHDWVDVKKIDTGFDLNFVHLKIKDVLDNSIGAFQKNLKAKNLELLIEDNYPNFPFLGDIAGIEKVFKNLLDLCIHESYPETQIKIKITPIKGHRKSDLNRMIYKLSFIFTGSPLTEHEEKLLFDNKMEHTTKQYYLKLAASRHIMILHKGSINYEKLSTNKIKFSVILPSSIETLDDNDITRGKILIIGENLSDFHEITSLLEELKIHPLLNDSYEKSIETLNTQKIRLIILDYEPSVAGFTEFIKILGSTQFYSIPVIACLIKENQKIISKHLRYFSDILSKPIIREEFLTKLEYFFVTPIVPITDSDTSKKMILIVDENKKLRNEFKELLSNEFSPILCKNGIEALYFLKKYQFVCAIIDAEMSEMDGIELITKIRQFDMKTPVIFSTQNHNEIYQRGASIFGISRIIKKPFSKNELFETLKETLENYEKI